MWHIQAWKTSQAFAKGSKKQKALTQPSLWRLHDTKVVMWPPSTKQLLWKWRGWYRHFLHLSSASLCSRCSLVCSRKQILWMESTHLQKSNFWQHFVELVPKSYCRLLGVWRDEEVSQGNDLMAPSHEAFKNKNLFTSKNKHLRWILKGWGKRKLQITSRGEGVVKPVHVQEMAEHTVLWQHPQGLGCTNSKQKKRIWGKVAWVYFVLFIFPPFNCQIIIDFPCNILLKY